jgi:hypothetical protein
MRPRILLFFALAGLTAWLVLSDGPTQRRMKVLNEAFAEKRLGHLEPRLRQRFEQQVAWIARHAGITGKIAVNDGIRRGRLNVVVTTTAFSPITHCGKGNAIYDSGLDTIFVDAYLLQPSDIPFIGQPGAITMFSLDQFGYTVSILSFILAHEMGHRQNADNSAAFFAFDWLRLKRDATAQELAADRFAVQTLMRAHQSIGGPNFLAQTDTLQWTGLTAASLDANEKAAADIMGTMIGMSWMLQFAETPYSPFFRDDSHPSFLERAAGAIAQVSGETSARVLRKSPAISEELRRTKLTGQWWHRELYAPEPLARVEVRDRSIWVGTRVFYQVGAGNPPERIYVLDPASESRQFVKVAEGRSPEEKLPGSWLDELLMKGGSAINLAPASPPEVREERLFKPYRKWQPTGLAYAGQGWFWQEDGREQGISAEELEGLARKIFSAAKIRLGKPQLVEGQILAPMLVGSAPGPDRLRVLILKAGQAHIALPPLDPNFASEDSLIDVEGVLRHGHEWLVPGRTAPGTGSQLWKVWQIADGAQPLVAAEGRLLSSFGERDADKRVNPDPDATQTIMQPLGRSRTLIWHYDDSVWLIGEGSAKIAFHPAPKSLHVTAIGDGRALFWMENALKAYLIDFSKQKGGENE